MNLTLGIFNLRSRVLSRDLLGKSQTNKLEWLTHASGYSFNLLLITRRGVSEIYSTWMDLTLQIFNMVFREIYCWFCLLQDSWVKWFIRCRIIFFTPFYFYNDISQKYGMWIFYEYFSHIRTSHICNLHPHKIIYSVTVNTAKLNKRQ